MKMILNQQVLGAVGLDLESLAEFAFEFECMRLMALPAHSAFLSFLY